MVQYIRFSKIIKVWNTFFTQTKIGCIFSSTSNVAMHWVHLNGLSSEWFHVNFQITNCSCNAFKWLHFVHLWGFPSELVLFSRFHQNPLLEVRRGPCLVPLCCFRLLFSCPGSSIPTLLSPSVRHYSQLWHNRFHYITSSTIVSV